MTPLRRGLVLAAVHCLLVCSLGVKMLYDRATRPRVWVKTAAYDPMLPIRGRYVSLRMEVETDPPLPPPNVGITRWVYQQSAHLEIRNGKLVAVSDPEGSVHYSRMPSDTTPLPVMLVEPIDFFLPEHAPDPSRLQRGEELWAEVTVPRKGRPRPIRLAVKRGEEFRPLDLR